MKELNIIFLFYTIQLFVFPSKLLIKLALTCKIYELFIISYSLAYFDINIIHLQTITILWILL